MGNVVGVRRCGKEGARKLLLDAHLDEIGFIVTGHQDGFLRFAPLGGVDPRMLPDRELTILSDPPTYGGGGLFCPPTSRAGEDMDRALPIQDLYLDTGLSQEEAQRRIPVGTPAVYRTGCRTWGQAPVRQGSGRPGLLRRPAGRGGAVEGCRTGRGPVYPGQHSGGDPQHRSHHRRLRPGSGFLRGGGRDPRGLPGRVQGEDLPLGKGPVIGLGPNCTKWMAKRMEQKAQELELPVQYELMAGSSGTNGWPMQIIREGIATALYVYLFPAVYAHPH